MPSTKKEQEKPKPESEYISMDRSPFPLSPNSEIYQEHNIPFECNKEREWGAAWNSPSPSPPPSSGSGSGSGSERERESGEEKKRVEGGFNQGRWTDVEHERFVEALHKYGKEWKKVQEYVGSRTSTQARSHAQKFFGKMEKNKVDVQELFTASPTNTTTLLSSPVCANWNSGWRGTDKGKGKRKRGGEDAEDTREREIFKISGKSIGSEEERDKSTGTKESSKGRKERSGYRCGEPIPMGGFSLEEASGELLKVKIVGSEYVTQGECPSTTPFFNMSGSQIHQFAQQLPAQNLFGLHKSMVDTPLHSLEELHSLPSLHSLDSSIPGPGSGYIPESGSGAIPESGSGYIPESIYTTPTPIPTPMQPMLTPTLTPTTFSKTINNPTRVTINTAAFHHRFSVPNPPQHYLLSPLHNNPHRFKEEEVSMDNLEHAESSQPGDSEPSECSEDGLFDPSPNPYNLLEMATPTFSRFKSIDNSDIINFPLLSAAPQHTDNHGTNPFFNDASLNMMDDMQFL